MRNLSIRQKLPLLIVGLLLAAVVTYSWASYRGARDAAMRVGEQRLSALDDQFASILALSAVALDTSTHRYATAPAVAQYLAAPGPRTEPAALAVLQNMGPRPEQNHRVDLLDAQGNMILSTRGVSPERNPDLEPVLGRAAKAAPAFAAVGHMRLLDDSVVVPSVAAVMVADKPVGYLVRWRFFQESPQGLDALLKLLGTGAVLYLGNDTGDFWTDLIRATPKPPVEVRGAKAPVQYARPGKPAVIAAAKPLPGTPWVVLIELSQHDILASADRFLRTSMLIGVLVLAVGALVAWLTSRGVTRPLGDLTKATAAIAAGDFSQTVAVTRDDEIGQLARSFNTMVAQVGDSQRSLEAKVRERTAQLQERNEELEAFAHSISHDLRAPLRAMHGFSKALLEDCDDQLSPTGKDYARRVVAAAQRMDALIQDLLAYGRVTRAELGLSRVDMSVVMREALAQLESEIAERGAKIRVAEPLPAVIGHQATLTQVMANLVSNAVKFVRPADVPAVEITPRAVNGHTRIWVVDNGIGMDPAHHERIFGVFERLHQADEYPGTGIGLAIVRKGVERMGGRSGVESFPGQGSRFWIELRLAEPAA